MQGKTTWIKAINKMKRSICPIVYMIQDAKGNLTYRTTEGTGFFVGKEGYFITAAHVIRNVDRNARANPRTTAVVVVPRGNWPKGDKEIDVNWFKFDLVSSDEENDLALCKTRINPFQTDETKHFVQQVIIDDTIPPDGTELTFTGFPLHNQTPISGRGTVASFQMIKGRNQRGLVLLVHAIVWPGVSGSPLYLENSRVVGLVTGLMTGRAQGITIARPARFIKALLESKQVVH